MQLTTAGKITNHLFICFEISDKICYDFYSKEQCYKNYKINIEVDILSLSPWVYCHSTFIFKISVKCNVVLDSF